MIWWPVCDIFYSSCYFRFDSISQKASQLAMKYLRDIVALLSNDRRSSFGEESGPNTESQESNLPGFIVLCGPQVDHGWTMNFVGRIQPKTVFLGRSGLIFQRWSGEMCLKIVRRMYSLSSVNINCLGVRYMNDWRPAPVRRLLHMEILVNTVRRSIFLSGGCVH